MEELFVQMSSDYEKMYEKISTMLEEVAKINKMRIINNINNDVPFHTFGLVRSTLGLQETVSKEKLAVWLNDVETIMATNNVFLAYDAEDIANFDPNTNCFIIRSRIYKTDIVQYCTIGERLNLNAD